VPLTSSSTPDELPSWSSDGGYIAFDSDADIYIVKPDGTGLLRVTSGRSTDIMPRWRPGP
jgi:TolB protein